MDDMRGKFGLRDGWESRRLVRVAGQAALGLAIAVFSLNGCKAKGDDVRGDSSNAAASAAVAGSSAGAAGQGGIEDAPAPDSVDGFDGKLAFEHVAKQVGFGPRPSGSQALAQAQDYILTQLKSYGCTADIDAFNADTPVGRLAMKNILVKIPGDKPGIIMLGTHYDTVLRNDITFVGADDGGSSTAVMLELARLLCAKSGKYAVWIAFFDGEEAMKQWSDTDSRYGSRQMAARLAASGDIKNIKAFLLADLVGSRSLHFMRDPSTKWLTDVVWSTADRLGYSQNFVEQAAGIEDDHNSFFKRNVPVVDVIDLDRTGDVPFWHTAEDTLDKISAKSLAITGHVFLGSIKELQTK
jgi:glutaminyl-peptide cyclotransferase